VSGAVDIGAILIDSSATQLSNAVRLGRINSAELQRRVRISDMRPRDRTIGKNAKLTHNELDGMAVPSASVQPIPMRAAFSIANATGKMGWRSMTCLGGRVDPRRGSMRGYATLEVRRHAVRARLAAESLLVRADPLDRRSATGVRRP